MKITGLINDVLEKSADLDQLDIDQLEELKEELENLKKNAMMGYPEVGDTMAMSTEVIKFDDQGQWSLQKSPPVLNYKKMNSPSAQKKPKGKETTLDYSSMGNASTPKVKPWTGARAKAQAAREKATAQIQESRNEEQGKKDFHPTIAPQQSSGESAAETIKRRQKASK